MRQILGQNPAACIGDQKLVIQSCTLFLKSQRIPRFHVFHTVFMMLDTASTLQFLSPVNTKSSPTEISSIPFSSMETRNGFGFLSAPIHGNRLLLQLHGSRIQLGQLQQIQNQPLHLLKLMPADFRNSFLFCGFSSPRSRSIIMIRDVSGVFSW